MCVPRNRGAGAVIEIQWKRGSNKWRHIGGAKGRRRGGTKPRGRPDLVVVGAKPVVCSRIKSDQMY